MRIPCFCQALSIFTQNSQLELGEEQVGYSRRDTRIRRIGPIRPIRPIRLTGLNRMVGLMGGIGLLDSGFYCLMSQTSLRREAWRQLMPGSWGTSKVRMMAPSW